MLPGQKAKTKENEYCIKFNKEFKKWSTLKKKKFLKKKKTEQGCRGAGRDSERGAQKCSRGWATVALRTSVQS